MAEDLRRALAVACPSVEPLDDWSRFMDDVDELLDMSQFSLSSIAGVEEPLLEIWLLPGAACGVFLEARFDSIALMAAVSSSVGGGANAEDGEGKSGDDAEGDRGRILLPPADCSR